MRPRGPGNEDAAKAKRTRSCPCTKSVKIVDLKPEDVIILTYMFSWITILEYMLI